MTVFQLELSSSECAIECWISAEALEIGSYHMHSDLAEIDRQYFIKYLWKSTTRTNWTIKLLSQKHCRTDTSVDSLMQTLFKVLGLTEVMIVKNLSTLSLKLAIKLKFLIMKIPQKRSNVHQMTAIYFVICP